MVWYWQIKQTHRSMEQNIKKKTEMDPLLYDKLIYYKAGKNIQWETDNLFNKCCWTKQIAISRIMKVDHFLTTYTKINSKLMKDLNIRQEAIKILDHNTGRNFFNHRHNNLLDMLLKARETKGNMNNWNLIKKKTKLLHSKGNNQQN